MSGRRFPDENSIFEHSPNGIALVDEEARIRAVNPAFRTMFRTGDAEVKGRKAAELLQSDCFERALAASETLAVRGSVPQHGVHYRATLFKMDSDNRCCGIFIDTTQEERTRAELLQVRRETLARAQEVIRHQMQTAQEIAGLLGETTAETKVLLAKVMDLFRQEGVP